jgi:hypothetical protein
MGSVRATIPDWRQLEGTPERKIKGRLDEQGIERTVPVGWMK